MMASVLIFVITVQFHAFNNLLPLLSSYLLFSIGDSAVYAAQGAILTEIFKTESRTISAGVSYQSSAVIAGGITSAISAINHSTYSLFLVPFIYILISVLGIYLI